jgi:hypothetical protein
MLQTCAEICIVPGTMVLVDIEDVMLNIPAIYLKRRGPRTHMVLIGDEKLIVVKPEHIKLNGSVEHEDQLRLHKAAKPYLKEGFRFVGY